MVLLLDSVLAAEKRGKVYARYAREKWANVNLRSLKRDISNWNR
jgi:hypothetical protein